MTDDQSRRFVHVDAYVEALLDGGAGQRGHDLGDGPEVGVGQGEGAGLLGDAGGDVRGLGRQRCRRDGAAQGVAGHAEGDGPDDGRPAALPGLAHEAVTALAIPA